MQSRPRHFWIPLFAALIAFVSGYLFTSGGFSFTHGGKPSVTQTAPDAVKSEATPAPLAPPVPSPAPVSFHWSQLESTDYATYIANLRAIGCPEPTVRDIISGDLASVYAQKRQALLAAQPQAAPEIQNKDLKALDAEQRSVLARLLEPPSAPSPSPLNASSDALPTQAATPSATVASDNNASAIFTPQITGNSGNPQAITLPNSAVNRSTAEAGKPVTASGVLSASGASSKSGASSANAAAVASAAASTSGATGASTASSASPDTSSAANSGASGQTTESAESATTARTEEAAANTTGSSGTRKWRSPFTPEEEAYRTKYGWRAFDEAQREAVRQKSQ